jgi:hypothetical protein
MQSILSQINLMHIIISTIFSFLLKFQFILPQQLVVNLSICILVKLRVGLFGIYKQGRCFASPIGADPSVCLR